jgi:MoxR-like ATPase
MAARTFQKSGELENVEKIIIDLVRLGLDGDRASVRALARKLLSRQSRAPHSEVFREHLGGLLVNTDASPLRAAKRAAALPIEPESKLPLATVEAAPAEEAPVLAAAATALLERLLAERTAAPRLRAAGLEPPKTLLLSGEPGVGKTMTARYLASRLGLPLLTVELTPLMSSLLGKTGQNLRQLLDYARAEPCVLLLDEFDAVAKRRDDQSDIGELKRLVNVLLLELDRWPSTGLLIAATNHPQLLDPAVGRRFDLRVQLERPAQAERTAILLAAAERLNLTAPPGTVAALALAMDGASGADLHQAVTHAARRAVLEDCDFQVALAEIALGPLRASDTKDTEERAAFCALAVDDLGLSNREVARLLGVTHPTVSKLAKQWRDQYPADTRLVSSGAAA